MLIITVWYRVKSQRGTQFRKWANKVLKDYLLRGYTINQRFERLEHRVANAEEKIDFFVRTSIPPVEGVFYDGHIFDAYVFATDLIKSAKRSLSDSNDHHESHHRPTEVGLGATSTTISND